MRKILAGVMLLVLVFAVVMLVSKTGSGNVSESSEQWEYLVVAGGQSNITSTPVTSLRKETTGSFSREQFPL
ncbi:MAG: hypothetical protein AB1489_41615, partial [Acidobacteriota bacterium]